ncbi:MAG: class I SAM-dependent methyltransferase [Bacteroidota bacterium]
MVRESRRAIKTILHPAIAPAAIRAFQARTRACRDREQVLDLAYTFDYARIRIEPMQVRSEIASFLERIAARQPRVVLEIGTANGGNLFLLASVAAADALVLSIDLPRGRFGGGYPGWKRALYRAFGRAEQEIALVRGDSHDPETAARIAALLGGRSVDLLFIDGDHAYEGVSRDYEMYAPLVGPGGIVAFHDIVPGPEEAVGGVPRFWRELKRSQTAVEIVADWSQGGYGIGYVERSA